MKKISLFTYLFSTALLLSGCGDAGNDSNKDVQKLQAELARKAYNDASLDCHDVEIIRTDKRQVLVNTSGLTDKQLPVAEIFDKYIKAKLFDFNRRAFINDSDLTANYDEEQAITDPESSIELSEAEDPAGIKRRENVGKLYLIENDDNQLEKIVVPIRGFGRFSLLYGFMALDANDLTIDSIGFYQHGETPALGGKFVSDERVTNRFVGKKVFKDGKPNFTVLVKHEQVANEYSVDGISGATYSNKAVENAINYWSGEQGFGPAIRQLVQ